MISVIIATKNGSLYIKRAIESVQKQHYATDEATCNGLEIIVVSDGSTDTTAELIRELAAIDTRIRLIELHTNIGPGRARDLAIRGGESEGQTVPSCKGDYIALLDDDDVWINPDKLINQKKCLDTCTDIVLVGASRVAFVREHTNATWWLENSTDKDAIRSNMLAYNPIITSSAFFRKDTYLKAGGFSDMYLAEDYELWLRMGKVGGIINIPGAETQYTVRDSGAARSNIQKMNKVVLQLAVQYRKDYPRFLYAYIKGYARIVLFAIKNAFK